MCPFHVPGLLWLLTTLAAFRLWLLLSVGQASRRRGCLAHLEEGAEPPALKSHGWQGNSVLGDLIMTRRPMTEWTHLTGGKIQPGEEETISKDAAKKLGGWGFHPQGSALGNSQENPAPPPSSLLSTPYTCRGPG